MSNEHDPHAENKRLYAIDVALVGEDEAPERWQVWAGTRWLNYLGSNDKPSWMLSAEKYRRDPEAPPLPSWDWHESLVRRKWAKVKNSDNSIAICFISEAQGRLFNEPFYRTEARPPQAWFAATANMTRAEYEALQRLARGEAAEPDSEGWIAWHGNKNGECPLSFGTKFQVFWRGNEKPDPEIFVAPVLFWKHCCNSGDIIAYRVIEPASEPADDGVLREPAKDAPMNKPLPAQGGSAWHPDGHVPADDCDPRLEREIERLTEQYAHDFSEYKEIVQRLADESTALGMIYELRTQIMPRLRQPQNLSDLSNFLWDMHNTIKTLCDSIDDAAESMAREELQK